MVEGMTDPTPKYDAGLYDHGNHDRVAATLKDGAFLYRVTSRSWVAQDVLLTGDGPKLARTSGRFHFIQQSATYCSTNILTALSEVLYHSYRSVLDRMTQQSDPDLVLRLASYDRYLVIFRVREIRNLAYLDAVSARVIYGGQFGGTMTVCPDKVYEPFQKLSNDLRERGKKGLFYPSARHSEGLCVVLFDDESSSIIDGEYHVLKVKLKLISEDAPPKRPTADCHPYMDKLHPTMGYYQFEDPSYLQRLDAAGMINPSTIPPAGFIEFVRHPYNASSQTAARLRLSGGNYPANAVVRAAR